MQKQIENSGLSVVLPVYNEAACVETTLRELAGVLDGLPGDHEIIAVDDGSTDGTTAILGRLSVEWGGRLRVVRLTPNSGQSAAFGAGFRLARFPLIVTMDADGQNDPADLPALLARMDDADVVCGVRIRRRDTWSKRLASRIGNGVRNAVLGERIADTGCSLKVFRATFVQSLPMWTGMHRFLPSLCAMQGARILQMPVNHRPRARGVSKYSNWSRFKATLADLLAVRWMKSRYRRFDVEDVRS